MKQIDTRHGSNRQRRVLRALACVLIMTLLSSIVVTQAVFAQNGTNTGTIHLNEGTTLYSGGQLTNNTSGTVTNDGDIIIAGAFDFQAGTVDEPNNGIVIFQDNATATNATDNSHVDGWVRKIGDDAFTFPTGDGGVLGPIAISAPGDPSATVDAIYYNDNPLTEVGTSLGTGLTGLSGVGYWELAGASSINVTLHWNSNSNISSLGGGLSHLRMAGWDGSQWVDLGNVSSSGDLSVGSLAANNIVPNMYSAYAVATSIAQNTPVINVMPTNPNFGVVNIGSTSSQTITIQSSGTATLTVSSITLADTSGLFSTSGGTCGATPFNLPIGASCTVIVDFAPTGIVGSIGAGMTIAGNGGDDVSVSLLGVSASVDVPVVLNQVTVSADGVDTDPGDNGDIVCVPFAGEGVLTNKVMVTADELDLDASDNSNGACLALLVPDLAVTIGQPAPDLVVGVPSNVPVTVTNSGGALATGPLTATVSLPISVTAAATFDGGNGWSCTTSAQTVTCVNAGPLASGADSLFNIPVTPDASAKGTTPSPFTVNVTPIDGEIDSTNNGPVSMTPDTAVKELPAITITSPVTGTYVNQSEKAALPIIGMTEPNITVTVFVTWGTNNENVFTKTVTADANGNYTATVDVSAVPDGEFVVDAQATNDAGTGNLAGAVALMLDTQAPAVTINKPIAGDNRINADEAAGNIAITGTTEANIAVTVAITDSNNNVVTQTVTADANGKYTATLDVSGLTDGTLTVGAEATDAAGNMATATPVTVTLDTQAPAVTITEPTAGDAIGNDMASALPVIGTTDPGVTVTVTITDSANNVVMQTVMADASGKYTATLDVSGLTDGTLTVGAKATDAAGNMATAIPVTVTLDTQAPAVTITEPMAGDAIGNDMASALPVIGTTDPGVTVTVTITDSANNVVMQTVMADASGKYTATLDVSGLTDGTLTVGAKATDAAGNMATATPVTVTLDTQAPAVTITEPMAGDAIGSDKAGALPVVGMTDPGVTVTVTITDSANNVVMQTVMADANGKYTATLDVSGLTDGALTVGAKATDAAGNMATATPVTVTLDTQAPAAAVMISPSDGAVITTTTPLITGTGEVGTIVSVMINGQTLTTTVSNDGTWHVTPAVLPYDVYTPTVTITDAAGNSTGPVNGNSFTVKLTHVLLAPRVFLGGAYAGSDTLMHDDLRAKGLLEQYALTEPYSSAPYSTNFTHVGGGGNESINAAVLAVTGDNAIVDWVFIEVRDTMTNVVATRSALLQRDGDVVDVDGVSPVAIPVEVGDYYIAIRHRNHLGAMMANPVTLSDVEATVDFTGGVGTYGGNGNVAQQAFGSNFGLRAGNADMDRRILNSTDRPVIRNVVTGASGNTTKGLNYTGVSDVYSYADINMDGAVRVVADSKVRGSDEQVMLNVILYYPGNDAARINFKVSEWLP